MQAAVLRLELPLPTDSLPSARSTKRTGAGVRNTASGTAMHLPQELDDRVEELLLEWWPYECGYRGVPRGARASSAYAMAKENRRDMSAEQLLRSTSDPDTMAKISSSIADLPTNNQIAIGVHFRNAYSRAAVFRSNRLNGRDEEHYVEAKALLVPLFRRRGIDI